MGIFDLGKAMIKEIAKETINEVCNDNKNIGNKTIADWDGKWKSIGMLKNANLTPYNNYVGLYKHVINGKTMYVGRAIEYKNGGFRKRLSDYRRESNSARKHSSGRMINENIDKIQTYILIVGNDEKAVEITKKLEGVFINRYHPEWNKITYALCID